MREGGPRWFWRTFWGAQLAVVALIVVAAASGRFWAVYICGAFVLVTLTLALARPIAFRRMRADEADPINTTEWERRWYFRWAMLMAVGPIVLGVGMIVAVILWT